MAASGADMGTGIAYQWEVSLVGGGLGFANVVGGTGATTTSYTTGPLAAGTYYYRLRVDCSNGPVTGYSNELTLTVNPTPAASASNSGPVCAGTALNLTGTTDIGTSFQWTGPNGFSSTDQNPSIPSTTTAANGTYSFTASLAGCTSAPATTAVTINAAPSVTIDPPIVALCPLSSATLTATGSEGSSLEGVLAAINSQSATLLASIPSGTGFAEGVSGNSISDGCNDMYDGGNFLNTNLASGIAYSNNTVINSASFGPAGRYFTQVIGSNVCNGSATAFLMAADLDGVSSFSITGNNGADGSGTQQLSTFTVTGNGITYTVLIKRVFGAFDPSINQMFLIPTPNGVSHTMGASTDDSQHNILGLTGVTRIYYMLYAGLNGAEINDAGATAIAQSLANIIPNPTAGTYLWAPGGETTDAISVSTAGTYTVTYTSGGCSNTASRIVTVADPFTTANITGTAFEFCTGGSVTLTATPTNGSPSYTYQWSRPDASLAGTGQSQVADVPGVWSVQITDNCGTVATFSSPALVENPNPTATASAGQACLTQDLNLTGTTDIGTVFTWTGPNGFPATARTR